MTTASGHHKSCWIFAFMPPPAGAHFGVRQRLFPNRLEIKWIAITPIEVLNIDACR
jgi:hypothetical protein